MDLARHKERTKPRVFIISKETSAADYFGNVNNKVVTVNRKFWKK